MANESTAYDPHSMDETLNEIYSLNLDGRIIKNKDNTWRMRTNRELRQDARALATGTNNTGSLYTAEDYANGNVMFSGGKKRRQRIFDRTFKRHYDPTSIENETEDNVALHHNTQSTIDPTKLSSHKLNNLSQEEQQAVARWWRNPNRLLGQIGGGMEDPIANAHARAYVEPLTDAAFYGIGSAMLGTNPITTTALTEGGAALKEALPYAKEGVNVLKNWWAKPRSWYNPIQTAKSILDPRAAKTSFGRVASQIYNKIDTYNSMNESADVLNKWTNGDFDFQDIPRFGVNIFGLLNNTNPAVKSILNIM